MFSLLTRSVSATDLLSSRLLDENTFYQSFIKDLNKCGNELIIESPFITNRRLDQLMPAIQKLKKRKVRVIVNTRDPLEENDEYFRYEAHRTIASMQKMGIQVLYTCAHHRKLAIIDRRILYEGSLNILSQNNSCEIMRRIDSHQLAWQMARFIEIDKFF